MLLMTTYEDGISGSGALERFILHHILGWATLTVMTELQRAQSVAESMLG